MKKTFVAMAVVAGVLGAFAAPPFGGRGPRPGHRPPAAFRPGGGCHRPMPPPPPPRHHHSCWGRGGRNFWPGFVGGVIGGAVARTVVSPAPVVVTSPAVVTAPAVVTTPTVIAAPSVVTTPTVVAPATTVQNVWVPGRYVDQIQPNGTVVRIWQAGHYEQRTVLLN